MGHDKLTAKQEAFALEYYLNGKIAIDAYQKVYDVKKDASKNQLYVNAHRVLKNNKVSLRIHQLEMAEYSEHILTIEERKQLLTKMSKDGDIKAIDLLNKMDNVYTEKIDLKSDVSVQYYAPKKNEEN